MEEGKEGIQLKSWIPSWSFVLPNLTVRPMFLSNFAVHSGGIIAKALALSSRAAREILVAENMIIAVEETTKRNQEEIEEAK